jgi:serralysin
MGLAGNDVLDGGAGNDLLIGGLGRDFMTGGANVDRFEFNFVSEIGRGVTRDVITDFAHLTDKIDLYSIDANGAAAGHRFTFLAAHGAAFTGAPGELRWFQQNVSGTANDKTIIEGDINGDRAADFQIQLTGLKPLSAADFIL